MAMALALSVVIELRALETGRWWHTELAVLLPGTSISLVPVLQLIVLFPLSFLLARWLLARIR